MANAKTPVRLSSKALSALKLAYKTDFSERVARLENIGEHSFAILIYWNRVEALLKALKYYDKIDEGYPDRLTFVSRNWRILKRAHENDAVKYAVVLGEQPGSEPSLWWTRNAIVHSNLAISKGDYLNMKSAAVWFFGQLFSNLPLSYLEAHKNFLNHKKKQVKGTAH